MNQAAHTPGPWRLEQDMGRHAQGINDYVWSDAESCEEREDASQWCIATVHAREEVSTRIANARLISAAPDLAEALQKFIACCHNGERGERFDLAYQAGVAALKKAGL